VKKRSKSEFVAGRLLSDDVTCPFLAESLHDSLGAMSACTHETKLQSTHGAPYSPANLMSPFVFVTRLPYPMAMSHRTPVKGEPKESGAA